MNTYKTVLISASVVLALAMILDPLTSSENAFAGGGDDNLAKQIISQVQKSTQNSQVVSGGNVEGSGNNFNFQFQNNEGNNALAQD
jgi:hypothetical protein